MARAKIRPIKESILGRQILFVIGVFFVVSVALSGTANALSLLGEDTVSFGPLQAKDKELYELEKKLESKKLIVSVDTPKIEEAKKEALKTVEQEKQVTEQVSGLKEEISKLQSMFVKIDKYAGNANGNRYALGNCTWYVKSKRPDINNMWGNANSWYANAKAQGWNVGSTPKKGAIATTTAGWAGHVAYVEKVTLDGQYVTISEMNYGGLYNMNTRTVHYSEFNYIYELN